MTHCRFLRERFQVLESQEASGTEPAVLSVLALTRGLTRSEAAKLFYQVCGARANTVDSGAHTDPMRIPSPPIYSCAGFGK